MPGKPPDPVLPAVVKVEPVRYLGVVQGFVPVIGQQVLLRDVGDVCSLVVFREEMVERLVLAGTDILGNGLVPFLGVVEFRVDIEDDSTEIEESVLDHLADLEFCAADHVRGVS